MSEVDYKNLEVLSEKIHDLDFGEDTRITIQDIRTGQSALREKWFTVYLKFTIIDEGDKE